MSKLAPALRQAAAAALYGTLRVVSDQAPAGVRHAARRRELHGRVSHRPSSLCTAQRPPAGSGWPVCHDQIDASIRPSWGRSWSNPNRFTPQAVMLATRSGVSESASESAGDCVGSVAADTNVLSS